MTERRGSIDQGGDIDRAVRLTHISGKGVIEVELANGGGYVGRLAVTDEGQTLVITDGLYGQPEKPHLIRLPEPLDLR